ncbi:hypothetical protein ONZ43_g1425 [Nemania bipapillata]|uniref:Uncharacterized protein n=1 Tax=Nemania bipapillata TaxID=110536 RepID=A0ACC2J4E0_9PEZI|nr:hypothetical protein ONZ43_g1425 [Nemania bipapillata]
MLAISAAGKATCSGGLSLAATRIVLSHFLPADDPALTEASEPAADLTAKIAFALLLPRRVSIIIADLVNDASLAHQGVDSRIKLFIVEELRMPRRRGDWRPVLGASYQ